MTERRKAAIYARISSDPEGRKAGVDRQVQDCRTLAERLDFLVDADDVYIDNDISASDPEVERPAWNRMLAAAHAGEFDAILAYSQSRLTRAGQTGLLPLEALAASRGLEVYTVGSGRMQLDTADGQLSAGIMALFDRAEAKRIGERVKRAAKQRAEEGKIHGSIPVYGYGYVRDASGRVQTMAVVPDEAALVREAADRVLAGETLYGIVADFDRRGLRTRPKAPSKRNPAGLPDGGKWQSRTINRILTTPTVAGFREYEGKLYKGDWKPILDENTWRRIVAMFDERAQTPSNFKTGNARKYALSGLVRCGTCGHTMVSMTPHKHAASPSFTCNGHKTGGCGHMKVSMALLEPYVVGRIKAYLSSPAFKAAHKKAMQAPAKAKAVLDVTRDREALERARTLFIDGDLTKKGYEAQVERIERRMAEAQVAASRASRDTVITSLPGPDEFVRLWQEHDNAWCRTIASAVIQDIVVSPQTWSGTTNVTRRRDETEAAFVTRKAKHDTAMMRDRVAIVGHDGRVWTK
jgi:DNA invertase Pin-like site-specific DNA recombinase